MHRGLVVVAVVAHVAEPGRAGAGVDRRLRIAVLVAVPIEEARDRDALVEGAVAVVVEAVADLGRARGDRAPAVVAVDAADEGPIRIPVAAGRVGEAVPVAVALPEGGAVAVLVVVVRVAHLDVAGEAVPVPVVAVVAAALKGGAAVPVRVGGEVAGGDAARRLLVADLPVEAGVGGRGDAAEGGRLRVARRAALDAVAEHAVVAGLVLVADGPAAVTGRRGRRTRVSPGVRGRSVPAAPAGEAAGCHEREPWEGAGSRGRRPTHLSPPEAP